MSFIHSRKALSFLVFRALAALFCLSAFGQDTELFYLPSGKNDTTLTASQQVLRSHWEEDVSVVDWFFVQGDPSLLLHEEETFRMPVLDREIFLNKQHAELDMIGNWNWSGQVLDLKGRSLGEAVLVLAQDGGLTGSLRVEKERYLVRPMGEGLHVVQLLQDIDRGNDQDLIYTAGNGAGQPQPGQDFSTSQSVKDRVYIDLLVAYTLEASREEPNLLSLISMAVTQANNTMTNNNIAVTFNLVYLHRTNYRGSGDSEVDLPRFQGKNDGYMDEVHQLRNASGADMCVLYSNVDNVAGHAFGIGVDEDEAFAVCSSASASDLTKYVLIHELGHLFGCAHDPVNARDSGVYPYGHGYRVFGIHASVMAYHCGQQTCPRVPYFSTPLQTLNGYELGNDFRSDNARVIRENMFRVKQFRNRNFEVKTPALGIFKECFGTNRVRWTTQPGIIYRLYKETFAGRTLVYEGVGNEFVYRMNRFELDTYFLVQACSEGTCTGFSPKRKAGYVEGPCF